MTLPEHKLRKLTECKLPWGTGNGHCFQRKARCVCVQEIKLVFGD